LCSVSEGCGPVDPVDDHQRGNIRSPFAELSVFRAAKLDDRNFSAIGGITIEIPVEFRRRAGRKHITAPNGKDLVKNGRRRQDRSLIKALVRAHEWQEMLETGRFRTVAEIIEKEKMADSYVRKIIRLTELAPDITTAIMNGEQPKTLTLSQLMNSFPICWEEQRQAFSLSSLD
jgi:hypothetical protein